MYRRALAVLRRETHTLLSRPRRLWVLLMSTSLKVLLIFVAALLATVAYFRWVINPQLIETLKADPDTQEADKVLVLTLPSGRQLPVNYLREDERVYLGADFGWWRELVKVQQVTLCIRAQSFNGAPRVVTDDPAFRDQVFSRLRPAAQWLPEALEAQLVVIELAGPEPAGPCS